MASRTKASEQLSDFAAAKKVCGNVRYYLLISCLRICLGGIDVNSEKNIVPGPYIAGGGGGSCPRQEN